MFTKTPYVSTHEKPGWQIIGIFNTLSYRFLFEFNFKAGSKLTYRLRTIRVIDAGNECLAYLAASAEELHQGVPHPIFNPVYHQDVVTVGHRLLRKSLPKLRCPVGQMLVIMDTDMPDIMRWSNRILRTRKLAQSPEEERA